jgi:hypothetical protein
MPESGEFAPFAVWGDLRPPVRVGTVVNIAGTAAVCVVISFSHNGSIAI